MQVLYGLLNLSAYYLFSQDWFDTVQDVLQALWQDVLHSPQPPFTTVCCNFLPLIVLMCFIENPLRIFFDYILFA